MPKRVGRQMRSVHIQTVRPSVRPPHLVTCAMSASPYLQFLPLTYFNILSDKVHNVVAPEYVIH